ncbi:hypothetical protein [Halodesulfovibrio sp.]|jgi:uncharacterized protein YndB with AHSA1/START domain|uniref:hypothetical protein n=1 Tax=Halodesulfovibrio sp. TaxID=1912772 RepID=UPI0025ED0D06|nr:hypothetical protein [Halodesulfovibrio sp.]MCT4626977.1 hypothetical protein [Halodesulfovibrio sp.]
MWKLFMAMMGMFAFAQEGAGGGESGGDAGGAGDTGAAGDDSAGDGDGSENGGSGDESASGGGNADEQGGADDKSGAADNNAAPDLTTPEGYLEHARAHGAFDSADKYSIPTEFKDVEMPEHLAAQWDIKNDAAIFATMAAKHGLTQAQAEGVFKDYVASAIEISGKAEAEALDAQKPESIMKEIYGDKAAEAMPALERGLKVLGIDASKGLRTHHAMKAIAELGNFVGEDGNFHNASAGGGKEEEMSAEEWLKQAASSR